jgi:hypothetical protein
VLKTEANRKSRTKLIEYCSFLIPTLDNIIAESGWDTYLPRGHQKRSEIGREVKRRICERKRLTREEYDKLHRRVPVEYSTKPFRSYPEDEREDVMTEIEIALQRSRPSLQVPPLSSFALSLACLELLSISKSLAHVPHGNQRKE